MKLSVVIPARNEEGHIAATVKALLERLDDAAVSDFEILVVDDGSTDATASIVSDLIRSDARVRLHANTGLHGFGRAVRAGLDVYSGDAAVVYMADASDAPQDVLTYYRVLRDEAECAFGSRWIAGSEVVGYPRFKLLINRFANAVVRLMFGLGYNDVTNAFKGYRRNVIDGCRPLISPHFNLTIELPLKAMTRGYTHKVVPISWRNRTWGESQLSLQEQGSRYLFVLLNVWFEWLLVRQDYHRPAGEGFRPWHEDGGSPRLDEEDA